MAQDVVVNGTTYPAVESVALTDGNGNNIMFYPDAVRYVEQTLTEAQKAQARENVGIDEAFKAELVAAVIESLGGNPVFGYVDKNNNIIVSGNLPDGTYSVKYEMEDGSKVSIGNLVLDTNVYYSVTNNLTQCTNSNSATQAIGGQSYSATITAKSGYELKSVTVTMGGSPVTVSGGVINIANVTGNIVITAVAEEVKAAYTNLANPTSADWKDGYRLSISSGGTSALAGHITTNFIPCKQGDTLRVKGLWFVDVNDNTTGSSPNCKLGLYKASKEWIKGIYGSMGVAANATYGNKVSVNGDIQEYVIMIDSTGVQQAPSETAYLRIDGKFMDGYTKNDVIITINEPIE
jgi:hypothetical protein